MKNIIRLTESDLHRLVKESARKILAEIELEPLGDPNKAKANMWKEQYETCMLRIPELLEKLKTYALEGDYKKARDVWEYDLSSEIQTLETAKWQVENNPNGEDTSSLAMR